MHNVPSIHTDRTIMICVRYFCTAFLSFLIGIGVIQGLSGCSNGVTRGPDSPVIPEFSSSPLNIVQEILYSTYPDSTWEIGDSVYGVLFRVPPDLLEPGSAPFALDVLGQYNRHVPTELRIVAGAGGADVFAWNYDESSALFEYGEMYYALPSYLSAASLFDEDRLWIECAQVVASTLRLRIAEPSTTCTAIAIPLPTEYRSIAFNGNQTGVLGLVITRAGDLVEIDLNGTPLSTWSGQVGPWTDITYDGERLLLVESDESGTSLFRLERADTTPSLVATDPELHLQGIELAGDVLYALTGELYGSGNWLAGYDVTQLLTGAGFSAARRDSVALPFIPYGGLSPAADGSLLTLRYAPKSENWRIVLLDTLGSISGEWLFINAWYIDTAGIGALAEPYYGSRDMLTLCPLLWRFEAPIDP
jgi:hypothetical protein